MLKPIVLSCRRVGAKVSFKFVLALPVVVTLIVVCRFINSEIRRFKLPITLRTSPTLEGLAISPHQFTLHGWNYISPSFLRDNVLHILHIANVELELALGKQRQSCRFHCSIRRTCSSAPSYCEELELEIVGQEQ